MEKLPGVPATNDLHLMKMDEIKSLFFEVCAEARHMMDFRFDSFGAINPFGDLGPLTDFDTCRDFLVAELHYLIKKIMATKNESIEPHVLRRLEEYVLKHVSVFDNEVSCFAHDDLIWFNVLHEGPHLTGLIDFDLDTKMPPSQILHWILLALHHPWSGPRDGDNVYFPNLQHLHLCNELLPIARRAFPDVFADQLLVRKMNILRIVWRLRIFCYAIPAWMTQLTRMLETEVPDTVALLDDSFYGKLLREGGCSC